MRAGGYGKGPVASKWNLPSQWRLKVYRDVAVNRFGLSVSLHRLEATNPFRNQVRLAPKLLNRLELAIFEFFAVLMQTQGGKKLAETRENVLVSKTTWGILISVK